MQTHTNTSGENLSNKMNSIHLNFIAIFLIRIFFIAPSFWGDFLNVFGQLFKVELWEAAWPSG